jgi:SWIM zinc finger
MNQDRALFRHTVAEIATKAKLTLPDSSSRIDMAVELVLAGDVELHADGTAAVASQTDPLKVYVVNGSCDCQDFQRAPDHYCKHRLAAALEKRVQAALRTPEPPKSSPAIPEQFLVMIQGKPFVKYAGLLHVAHERGLASLTETWTYNDAELSLAHAVATFDDGRCFEGSGDATPANTNRKVAPHFRRVALTRAKARALRDALNIDLCSVEELGEDV